MRVSARVSARVCLCVCVCVRACVSVCVCVRACVHAACVHAACVLYVLLCVTMHAYITDARTSIARGLLFRTFDI